MPKVKELEDYKDIKGWSRTTKGWNYHKPIHRINGPTPPSQPDGRGLDCGCRNETEAPFGEIASQIMRAIPNWVAVHPNDDREHELEGIVLRSIHSYTDSPFTQWHRWYDWNFHIDPAPGFEGLMGPANTRPQTAT